jgi:hypothetical protein
MPIRPVEVHIWWKQRTESLNSLKIGTILKDPSVDHDLGMAGTQNIGRLAPIPFNDTVTIDLFYQSVSANGKKRRIEWLDTALYKTISDAGGINDTIEFVGLSDTTGLVDGDLLKIENEIVQIIDVGMNPISIYRGQHGTTAASHVDGEKVIKLVCSVPYNTKILNGKPDALTVPLNLVATGMEGGIQLVWDHYIEPDRRLFSYYRIYRRATLADFPLAPVFANATMIQELSDNFYFDTSMPPEDGLISYTYWITSIDTSGNESDPSFPDEATPLSLGERHVPDDLECFSLPNGLDLLCGCVAWKWNHGIEEAQFRAKWYAVGTAPEFADLRTVAEGGTFAHNGTTQLIVTGVGATFAGANYSWISASAGTWMFAFKLRNQDGWSVWSDGNDTPQHVKDYVDTSIADTGPPADWYSTMEIGALANTVVVRTRRPQTNGNMIGFVAWQIKDTSTGSWYDPDANTGAAVTYYDGSGIAHTITQNVDGGCRVTGDGSGFGTASVGDMWMLDVREGSGLFAAHYCIWGLVDRFQNDSPSDALWFEFDMPFHNFYVGNNWRLKIVKPPWEWSTDGYFAGAVVGNGVADLVPQPWEYGGDKSTYEFVSPPIPYPSGVALEDLGARCWFQNGYSRSDDDEYVSGATAFSTAEGPFVLGITIDGGGTVPTTGVVGYLQVPFDCTINSWTMLADLSGSAVIDVWRDTYANFPPTNADSITASALPTITSGVKNASNVLTGWTVDINAGDILAFNIDSMSVMTRLHLQLQVSKR